MRITSGSTGQPIQMPAWKSEFKYLKLSNSLGRKWQYPGDRLFLFGGMVICWGLSGILAI